MCISSLLRVHRFQMYLETKYEHRVQSVERKAWLQSYYNCGMKFELRSLRKPKRVCVRGMCVSFSPLLCVCVYAYLRAYMCFILLWYYFILTLLYSKAILWPVETGMYFQICEETRKYFHMCVSTDRHCDVQTLKTAYISL